MPSIRNLRPRRRKNLMGRELRKVESTNVRDVKHKGSKRRTRRGRAR